MSQITALPLKSGFCDKWDLRAGEGYARGDTPGPWEQGRGITGRPGHEAKGV